MRKVKNIIYTFCAALFAAACTDGNDWVVDSSYDRLFATSESSFSITPAENAAQAEASWKATPNTRKRHLILLVMSLRSALIL